MRETQEWQRKRSGSRRGGTSIRLKIRFGKSLSSFNSARYGYGYPYGLSPPEKFGYFSFDAPNPQRNAFKVARALMSSKPVMFEGSQGAGKSSLIVALANATLKELVRLHLSKQTDLCDLSESDLPVVSCDDKNSFAWKDGPTLTSSRRAKFLL